MILWAVARITEMAVNRNFHCTEDRISIWLVMAFIASFLWQLIGLTYSENLKNGANILFSRLSMLVFPLLFVFPGQKVTEKGKLLLNLFAGSTALYILSRFIFAFIQSVSVQNGQFIINTHPPEEYWMSYFYGSYFSGNQHPSYLVMYVILSVFIAFESALDQHLAKYKRLLWATSAFILLVSVYFLSSRAGFLVILLLMPLYFLVKIWQRRKLLFAIVSITLLVLVISSIILTNERIKTNLEQISDGSFNKKIADDGRLLIWKSSVNIIKKNVLFGVGIGDVRDKLMKEYELIGDKDLINSRYNAHNQFLEVSIEGGIIGLMIFLMIIGLMIYYAISKRNLMLGLFMFEMLIFFMFETVLYRLAGIIFFSIFSFLLLYKKEKMQHF